MKTVCIIGHSDTKYMESVWRIASDMPPTIFPQTFFKDLETGEITSIMPENKMFEITKQTFDEAFKSGKEKRRERRKQERKNKKL